MDRFTTRLRNKAIKDIQDNTFEPEPNERITDFFACPKCSKEESVPGAGIVFSAGWINNHTIGLQCVGCKKLLYRYDFLAIKMKGLKEFFDSVGGEMK